MSRTALCHQRQADGPLSSSREAGGSLSAILPILDAFNHRHRNQHRASHWWATFGRLRRALARLAACLRPHAESATPPPAVALRARWLERHLIPSAYVAFTQLAADNQHAPLGLLLLAVLGHTHAVLAYLLSSEISSLPSLNAPTKPVESSSCAADPPGEDFGVVVSRRELFPPGEPVTPATCDEHSTVADSSRQNRHPTIGKGKGKSTNSKPRKRGKHAEQDALSSLFSSLI